MNIVDESLDKKTVGECDYILISVYPQAAIEWLRNIASNIRKNSIVFDCCGIKQRICSESFEIVEKFGFTFIGGHPR